MYDVAVRYHEKNGGWGVNTAHSYGTYNEAYNYVESVFRNPIVFYARITNYDLKLKVVFTRKKKEANA